MHGNEALNLIREAKRAGPQKLLPYNEDGVRNVLRETLQLQTQLQEIRQLLMQMREAIAQEKRREYATQILVNHASVQRNRRCFLAYHKHRMDVIRLLSWESGAIPPEEVRRNMSAAEVDYMRQYNRLLTAYKSHYVDLDLTASLLPPKELYVEVRVLEDCGRISTEYGTVHLERNSQHFLRRTDVEQLVKQGYLQHLE